MYRRLNQDRDMDLDAGRLDLVANSGTSAVLPYIKDIGKSFSYDPLTR